MPDQKLCRSCSTVKPREAFGIDRRSADGLRYCCKACLRRKRREAREIARIVADAAERMMARALAPPEAYQPEPYDPHVGFTRYLFDRHLD